MRRYFFAMTTLYIAATVVQTSIVAGGLRWDESTLLRAVTLAMIVPLIWTRRPWYHHLATLATLAVLAYRLRA